MNFTPLYMSCVAGLSTGLGAATVFFQPVGEGKTRLVSPSSMCFALALAGSVMVTVSVISIIPECLRDVNMEDEFHMIPLWSALFVERGIAFSVGCVLYLLLSKLAFPEPDEVAKKMLGVEEKEKEDKLLLESSSVSGLVPSGSHEDLEMRDDTRSPTTKRRTERKSRASDNSPTSDGSNISNITPIDTKEERKDLLNFVTTFTSGADLKSRDDRRAWRLAMLLFISLAFHNFPEGLAVAASALESQKLGLTVTIGIMIHNIPEGIAIAIPCLAARPDQPALAFWMATLSGLAEPLGALVALILLGDISDTRASYINIDNVLAFVAGIMIMVAVAELFPEALRLTERGNGSFVAGTISGVTVMVVTELFLPS